MTRATRTALIGIVLLAGCLRFVGLDWGLPRSDADGYHLPYHPDETTLTFAALRQIRPSALDFNPEIAQSEGTFFYYLLGGVEMAASVVGAVRVASSEHYQQHPTDLRGLVLVARGLAATFGVLAVVLVFIFGSRVGGEVVGIIASLWMATMPINVLSGHFARPHTLLDVLIAGTFVLAWKVHETGDRRALRWGAAVVGVLASTRYPMIMLFSVLAVALVVRRPMARVAVLVRELARALAISIVVLLVTCPTLVFESSSVAEGVGRHSPWTSLPDPATLGWELRALFIQVGEAAMTLPLVVLSLVSITWVLRARRDFAIVTFPWMLIWVPILLLYPAATNAARWLEPIFPIVLVASALFVVEMTKSVRDRLRAPVRIVVVGALTVYPLMVSASHVADMADRDPRLALRGWMKEHVDEGASIGVGRAPDIFGVGVNSRLPYQIVVTNKTYQPYPPIDPEDDVPELLERQPRWYLVANWQKDRIDGRRYRRSMSDEKHRLLFGPRGAYRLVRVFRHRTSWLDGRLFQRSPVSEEYIISPVIYVLERR